MANFEAINLFWNGLLESKNEMNVKYEELVEDPAGHQKKI